MKLSMTTFLVTVTNPAYTARVTAASHEKEHWIVALKVNKPEDTDFKRQSLSTVFQV